MLIRAATVKVSPVGPPDAGAESVVLKDRTISPKGEITLRNKSESITLDVSTLSFSGSVKSIGSTNVSCGAATGADICPEGVTYGGAVGQHIRRGQNIYTCDGDQTYDLGELCGNKAIWLISYDHWVADGNFNGKDVLEAHSTIFNKYRDEGLAAVFVVKSGSQEVVVNKIGRAHV